MSVSVRLFHAGQRLNKDFFRDPETDGSKRRRSAKDEDESPALDGKGLLKLFAKGPLSPEELAVVVPLMRKQSFVAVSVALENVGDLRSLHSSITRRAVQPSGVIREVPVDADGVARVPPTHQDMGIAFEVQFNTLEELRRGVALFQAAIEENRNQRTTWYSRIAGCCHRHIEMGNFWRKYDVFKYDFDQEPRLHVVFHPNVISYSLLASWPCRLKGDSVYQRFALRSPFVSPVVETIPNGEHPPRCDCASRTAAPVMPRNDRDAAAPTAAAVNENRVIPTVVRVPKGSAAEPSAPVDALFNITLPPMYHIGPTGAPPAGHAPLASPSTITIPPLQFEASLDLLALSPESFLISGLETIQMIDKSATGFHFFSDLGDATA